MGAERVIDIHDLRKIVRWADGQNENIWDSSEDGVISMRGLILAYKAAGDEDFPLDVETVLAEGTPAEKRAMRRALKLRVA